MLIYYLIATLAALCWAIASLISADITRKIGGLAFNRLRLFFVSIMLISYTFYLDTWSTINQDFLVTILLNMSYQFLINMYIKTYFIKSIHFLFIYFFGFRI